MLYDAIHRVAILSEVAFCVNASTDVCSSTNRVAELNPNWASSRRPLLVTHVLPPLRLHPREPQLSLNQDVVHVLGVLVVAHQLEHGIVRQVERRAIRRREGALFSIVNRHDTCHRRGIRQFD